MNSAILNSPSSENTNLYLLGFMATGKTMIGKSLAQKLDMQFIDADLAIEEKMNMPVKDIFSNYGEAKFRELERQFIENGHPKKGCIISCGGGLPCRDDMPELIKSKGISICLFAPIDDILERIKISDDRPLLNVPNPRETIEKLLEERMPYYLKSDVILSLKRASKLQSVNLVHRIYIDTLKSRAKKS